MTGQPKNIMIDPAQTPAPMTRALPRCSIVMAGGDIVYGLDVHPDDITQADRWLEIETHTGTVWLNPNHVSHFTERD